MLTDKKNASTHAIGPTPSALDLHLSPLPPLASPTSPASPPPVSPRLLRAVPCRRPPSTPRHLAPASPEATHRRPVTGLRPQCRASACSSSPPHGPHSLHTPQSPAVPPLPTPPPAAGSPPNLLFHRPSTHSPAPSTTTPGTASATAGPLSRRSPRPPPAAVALSRGSTLSCSSPRPGDAGSGSWGTHSRRTWSWRYSACSGRATAARQMEAPRGMAWRVLPPGGRHRRVPPRRAPRQVHPVENSKLQKDGIKGTYRVDVDIPSDDWVNITKFYDVLIFNTGHWWGPDKFPKETLLVFYKGGKPIKHPLGICDGLTVVLKSMASYIERGVPGKTLKLWRTQSPRWLMMMINLL